MSHGESGVSKCLTVRPFLSLTIDMSKTMSVKESSSVVPTGHPPLFSKFSSKIKDERESPKSVISDPRIVSPGSSASASLERRLTDLKKQPRHDRVHSISDAEEENSLPGVNLGAVPLTRQLSTKGSNGHLHLESVSEVHSLPSLPHRMGQTSAPPSETSSPRNRMSRNAGKDGARGFVRGSEGEFMNRRMSLPGADATTDSVLAPPPHSADHDEVDTESLTCSPKSSNHGVSDRTWRNAAGFMDPRPISLQTVDREPVQGTTRLAGPGEDSFQAVNMQSEGKDALVGSMYGILMNGFYGPTLEEIVSGRGIPRPGESFRRDSITVKINPGVAYEDQIELNKFVVRGTGGEEVGAGEHKIAWSQGTTREHRNSFSGDGRSDVSGYRPIKSSKTSFSPSESPGHANGFKELPRSALIDLSSDFVLKATSQVGQGYPEMHIVQKDAQKYSMKSSNGNQMDKSSTGRSTDGWKKSFESHMGSAASSSTFSPDGSSSLHALPSVQYHSGIAGAGAEIPDSHNSERSFQYGGKVLGAVETSKASLMPHQRFVPGQFLKTNPLKPRHPSAKWDEAEKWLVNPASAKSNGFSQHGNGNLSAGSTPQHYSQFHAAAAGRHYSLPGSNQNSRVFATPPETVLASAESYDGRLLTEDGDVSANAYVPTNVRHFHRSCDSSASLCEERKLPLDTSVSEAVDRDDALPRLEVKGHPLPDAGTFGKAKGNRLLVVNNVTRPKSEPQADDLRGSVEIPEAKKYPSEFLRVPMSEGSYDQKQDTFTATIFDQFTKDKFADSVTVQSTNPNSGREFIVMKDAATEITPSTSQRDIATQVTPVPSFHAAVTPPRIHTGGPARLNTTPVHSERRPASVGVDVTELQNCHQAKLELDQAATLDPSNWATREEEVEESARSLRLSVSRSVDFKDVKRNVLEARAAAWEEAEQSKYIARYHREEAKILAWEANHKAKAEADMRKTEVKLERMRSHANELLQNKLASVHLRAENMRAAAAAQCGEQAAKVNHWAQEIRAHGRSPSPTVMCCLPRFNSYSPWT